MSVGLPPATAIAGSPREREGWLGWLLKAMAWMTLAIGPILILLVFQFMFLPYQWTVRDRNRVASVFNVAIHVSYFRAEQAISMRTDLMRRAIINPQRARAPPNGSRETTASGGLVPSPPTSNSASGSY
jgi:hypothetical protein